MNTVNGEVLKEETIQVAGDVTEIKIDIPERELALSIVKGE
jgi:hypothetical protein